MTNSKSCLRVLFMGTPDFAIPSLKALIENFNVIGVVTQIDKPRGRGNTVLPTPIKVVAIENNIPVYQPQTFKDFAFENEVRAKRPLRNVTRYPEQNQRQFPPLQILPFDTSP